MAQLSTPLKQRVRTFLTESGAPPCAEFKENYEQISVVMQRRRHDDAFWAPLTELMRDLVDAVVNSETPNVTPPPEARLLALWDVKDLAELLRRTLPQPDPSDSGSFACDRMAVGVSPNALGLLLMLSLAASACSGSETSPAGSSLTTAGTSPTLSAVGKTGIGGGKNNATPQNGGSSALGSRTSSAPSNGGTVATDRVSMGGAHAAVGAGGAATPAATKVGQSGAGRSSTGGAIEGGTTGNSVAKGGAAAVVAGNAGRSSSAVGAGGTAGAGLGAAGRSGGAEAFAGRGGAGGSGSRAGAGGRVGTAGSSAGRGGSGGTAFTCPREEGTAGAVTVAGKPLPTSCCVDTASALWQAIDSSTLTSSSKEKLYSCFLSLNATWCDGLVDLFHNETPEVVANYLQDLLNCCYAGTMGIDLLSGDFAAKRQEVVNRMVCNVVLYKGVTFPS